MSYTRNSGPEFCLVNEPWIPVTPNGESAPVLIGLRQALTDAKNFAGLAEGNPLVKASLLRFLVSMAYLVIDEQAGGDKRQAVRLSATIEQNGFDESAVEAVCERWNDRLWLFHPNTPFCQDPRLGADTSIKKPLGPLAITPYLPGNDSSRWGVNMLDAESVSLDEAARLLLTNWFYNPVGNSARRTSLDNQPGLPPAVSRRVASAAAANFPNLTNFFRVGSSLHETIFFNILKNHLPDGNVEAVPAFLKVTELSIRQTEFHPLYAATLSASTSLLVESEPGTSRLSENFLRGSVLFDAEYADIAKRYTSLSLSDDPHVLYKANEKNSDNHPRHNLSGSLVSLPKFCLTTSHLVQTGGLFKAGVCDPKNLLSRKRSLGTLEILQIRQGGTANGRTIVGVELLQAPPDWIAPRFALVDDQLALARSEEVVISLDSLLRSSKSAVSYLRFAVRETIDPNSSSSPNELLRSIEDDFLNEIGRSVNRLVEAITNSGLASVDMAEQRNQWSHSVLDVFDRHTVALKFSQTSADRYWKARSSLSANLRRVLE